MAPENAWSAPRACPVCAATDGRPMVVRDIWHNKPGVFGGLVVDAERPTHNSCLVKKAIHITGRDLRSHGIVGRVGTVMLGGGMRRVVDLSRWFEPFSWLDVNCGDGAFSAIAGQMLTDTEFEGIDPLEWVHGAARRRWLTRGHKGTWSSLQEAYYSVTAMMWSVLGMVSNVRESHVVRWKVLVTCSLIEG